jgi:isochorismate hydrolase
MQTYTMPEWVESRLLRRRGRRFAHESIDAARSVLVVAYMQNHFVASGCHAEIPAVRDIVPNINRAAGALAMLSDANAAATLEEHVAALNSLAMFFADVMAVDEALKRLIPAMAVA